MADQQLISHAWRLLNRVRDAIRRRHYSYRTEQTYIHCVKRFIHFNDNSTFFCALCRQHCRKRLDRLEMPIGSISAGKAYT